MEIKSEIEAQGHGLGEWGELAVHAVLDARPDLRARWDALEAEEKARRESES